MLAGCSYQTKNENADQIRVTWDKQAIEILDEVEMRLEQLELTTDLDLMSTGKPFYFNSSTLFFMNHSKKKTLFFMVSWFINIIIIKFKWINHFSSYAFFISNSRYLIDSWLLYSNNIIFENGKYQDPKECVYNKACKSPK